MDQVAQQVTRFTPAILFDEINRIEQAVDTGGGFRFRLGCGVKIGHVATGSLSDTPSNKSNSSTRSRAGAGTMRVKP